MNIRKERPADYAEVYELVKTSFATAPHFDGTEADHLNRVRTRDTFIPELALLAEDGNGKIIGQVALCETTIATPGKAVTALNLSPLCVHPDYFRQGVARALVERALGLALGMGFAAVFLCGAPEIYRRLGFVPSYEYGITHVSDKDGNAEWCMARELFAGALSGITGTIDIV